MILTICYAMWLGMCTSFIHREYETEAACLAAEERLYTKERKPLLTICGKKITKDK